MFRKLFGGKSGAAVSPEKGQAFEDIAWPWRPDSTIRGNLAIGNMRENLLRLATVGGRVHAETLLATVGVLTGFAAQNAALLKGEQTTMRDGHVGQNDIVLIRTIKEELYLAGDDINAPLFGEGREPLPLIGFITAAAQSAGATRPTLPRAEDIATYVARTLGTDDFGRLNVSGENKPHRPLEQLLRTYWPHACVIFKLPLPGSPSEPELDEAHWPIVLSFVANQLLTQTASILNPLTGYTIVLESAVFASKIHPDLITPNRWRIEPKQGQLSVETNPLWHQLHKP